MLYRYNVIRAFCSAEPMKRTPLFTSIFSLQRVSGSEFSLHMDPYLALFTVIRICDHDLQTLQGFICLHASIVSVYGPQGTILSP
jgi:hypothetical protein